MNSNSLFNELLKYTINRLIKEVDPYKGKSPRDTQVVKVATAIVNGVFIRRMKMEIDNSNVFDNCG